MHEHGSGIVGHSLRCAILWSFLSHPLRSLSPRGWPSGAGSGSTPAAATTSPVPPRLPPFLGCAWGGRDAVEVESAQHGGAGLLLPRVPFPVLLQPLMSSSCILPHRSARLSSSSQSSRARLLFVSFVRSSNSAVSWHLDECHSDAPAALPCWSIAFSAAHHCTDC